MLYSLLNLQYATFSNGCLLPKASVTQTHWTAIIIWDGVHVNYSEEKKDRNTVELNFPDTSLVLVLLDSIVFFLAVLFIVINNNINDLGLEWVDFHASTSSIPQTLL